MRILITGCGGFMGKHLCNRLMNRTGFWEEAVLFAGVYDETEQRSLEEALLNDGTKMSRWPKILKGDMRDPKQVSAVVKAAKPDYVIHLAAQASVARSFREPELTMAVNVDGTANLLEALRQESPGARILLVGSIDQYGPVDKKEQPVPESHPLAGCSPYGKSKILQEQLARFCVDQYGQDIVLVRAAPHTGPGQARAFAVADWAAQIREMRQGERPHRLITGNLQVIRDITDVRDMAEAYLLLLEKGGTGEVYNAGTGKGVELSRIPPLLGKLGGIEDLQIETDPRRFRPADIPCLVADTAKLRERIGWKPVYTLEETLRDMLA